MDPENIILSEKCQTEKKKPKKQYYMIYLCVKSKQIIQNKSIHNIETNSH